MKDAPCYKSVRKKPVSRSLAKPHKSNKKFHKLGLTYAGFAHRHAHKLLDLKQLAFPELVRGRRASATPAPVPKVPTPSPCTCRSHNLHLSSETVKLCSVTFQSDPSGLAGTAWFLWFRQRQRVLELRSLHADGQRPLHASLVPRFWP